MRDKINQFNNLYNPVLINAEKIMKHLRSNNIDHALSFDNDYHVKINEEIVNIQYPIPNIICKLDDVKTKIGLDIATSNDYIGFVKFTINKDQIASFKFDKIKAFKFEIYGAYFCKEISNYEDLEKIRADIQNPRENDIFIKIIVTTIKEVETIIDNLTSKPPRDFAVSCYTCNCGHIVNVNNTTGQCPICGEDSPSKRKYKQKCPVCNHTTLIDQFGNGECEHCGWILSKLDCKRQNNVIYPNLISLNKARKLYKEGKNLAPDLNDFLEGLEFYGEMEFTYNNIIYGVIRSQSVGVEFWGVNTDKYETFKDIEEFKLKARIDGKLLKDIWHEVKNANWLQ